MCKAPTGRGNSQRQVRVVREVRWADTARGSAERRGRILPLPEGEGWGEGEGDARRANRVGTSPEVCGSPEGPYGFEPFIISILRLFRRSLTWCWRFYRFARAYPWRPFLAATVVFGNHFTSQAWRQPRRTPIKTAVGATIENADNRMAQTRAKPQRPAEERGREKPVRPGIERPLPLPNPHGVKLANRCVAGDIARERISDSEKYPPIFHRLRRLAR